VVAIVTAIGSVPPGRAWRRDGARVGDLLVASGGFGGSLLGRHLAVTPRCREAAVIAGRHAVHAAIDVSDGLALDVSRVMLASGTAAIIDLAAVPIHPDASRMASRPGDGRTPLEHALSDGEDFELVLALAADEARRLVAESAAALGTPFTVIGEVVEGSGLRGRTTDGTTALLAPTGFVHDFDS
jgi:thiamine-monophosphate kinase